ncbi:MAG: hypothetical protein SGBAC_010199, partial [Bacillariaceae sp.]
MSPKTITIIEDGGVYDISNNEEFKDLLESMETKYLENVDNKRRVVGFASLIDGGTYTAAPVAESRLVVNVNNPSEGDSQDSSFDGESSTNKRNDKRTPIASVLWPSSSSRSRSSAGADSSNAATELYRRLKSKQSDVVHRYINKGNESVTRNRYDEAMKAYQKALKAQTEAHGSQHLTAVIKSNIGLVLKGQGKYAESLKTYEETLSIRRELHGDRHEDIASTLENMGGVLEALGKLDEAYQTYSDALSMQLKIRGNNHPKVADTVFHMANVLDDQGEYEEAAKV